MRRQGRRRGSKPLNDRNEQAGIANSPDPGDFLASHEGETARLIREHDWASTPLGPISGWPQSLKTAIELMTDSRFPMFAAWGESLTFLYNDAYTEILGGKHPQALGRPFHDIWSEIWDDIEPMIDAALDGRATYFENLPLVMNRKGHDEQTWFTFSYSPLRGDDGRVVGMFCACVETTGHVEADREREATSQRLEMALSAGDGVGTWDWDVPNNRVRADERFARIYGVDPQKAREGAPITEFFGAMHPDDSDRVQAEIGRALETGEIFSSEYRLVQPDGEVRWVAAQGRASLSADGRPLRFPGVTFDITQRHGMTEALRESEERYRTLFGDSTTGLCIIQMKFDADQRPVDYMIVEGNAAFERLTGLVGANGKWVSEIAPGLERHWFDLYGKVALTGEPARFENPADIFGRWYDVQALRLGEPEARRVAILFNDITARKELELRQQVLLELNDAIRDLTDPAEIAQASAAILAEALKVSRVGYGVMDTTAETVTIERDYNAPGVKSIAGVIHFRDFGDYIEDLSRGDVVVFDDGGADPRVTDGGAALDSISARALINLPLIERGQVVALLFVNNATPRHWSEGDVALVREVAERVRTATERARATVALRRNAERLRFLDALNVEVAKVTSADEVLAVTTRMTAQHLKVANCAYADMDADQDGFTIRGDWAEPGMASIVGHYQLADFGTLAVQELGAGRPLIINDNLTEIAPEEAATFQAIGIGATICMPLVKGGRLTALMAVHQRGPHAWTAEELDTIREVTERSWAHVERVRSEAELRESEGRFRNMADNTPMMMWVTDPSGHCTYLNKTWYAFTGQTEAEAEGFGWLDATHPDDQARAGEIFLAANAAQAPFALEYRLRRADGVYRWAIDAASPRFDANGEYLGYVGSVIDIDDRREVEDALRAREAELRELNANLEGRVAEALAERKLLADVVESVDAFVQVIDPDFRWLAVNRAAADEFERVFGRRPEVGESLLEVLEHLPEEVARFRSLWSRALSGGTVNEVMEVGDPDRARSPHEIRLYPLRDGKGEVIGAFKFGYDVTERLGEQARLREAEEALRQSQKMEAVGQLTGGIAHDFNNLLAGIAGSLELLSKRLSEGRLNGMERYIDAAQGSTQRAASLTQRLLAFSRRQTLDPRPTDVNRLIHGMDDLIRRSIGPDVELEVVGAGGLWVTKVDPSQLENALLNLCINARDAMAPDGGRLTIETSNKWLDDRASRDRELPPGQYVSLCVTDTGTGMTPEVQAQVFDPFFTTKPMGQGTGLGLSMIHGFVRQSGGQVRIYSELGKGTTMCLYLPRYMGDVETGDAPPDQEVAEGGHGETVLVIDDEATVRMLVAEVLGDAGYRVIEAPDGPSGLEILRSDRRIDMLISDVGLPGGMNGRQVADAARETRPGLKVLFITGYAENAAVGNGLLAPGMEVITKPFVMAELALKVHEMIEG